MSGVVAFEGELNAIVSEYLEFNTFDKTLKAFERECHDKGKHVASVDNKPRGNKKLLAVQDDMMQYFLHGSRKEFFKLWNEYLPESISNDDPVAQKLEFYLMIFFAIYPMKYGIEDKDEGMNAFKVFLETRGAALSQTTEFLPFYALPFVPNPKTHPSYRELFSEKWVPDLRNRLEKFIILAMQTTPQPRLFELYKGSSSGGADVFEQKAIEAEKKTLAYLKRYNRVQADYHNLIGITADLVDSLEANIQGRPVSPEYLQHICMRLFSNQVRQSVDLTRPGTAGEILRQSVAPPQGLQHRDTSPGSKLDYGKIKHDLTSADAHTQCLLLQALRWKLTKSSPPERDAMLTGYINHDVLGCASHGAHRNAIMQLLGAESDLVQQGTARMFNAFASLCEGRSYLGGNPDLLRALMNNLKSDKRDLLTRENVLGCLQKLSLRRQMQSIMIDEGIIRWLVSVLEDNDSLSDYLLEYSVALLMNLCLRSAGKKKCIENANQTLKVLSDLLGNDNQEIIPYVNGTLYSILAIPSIREEAKAMDMEEILRCFLKDDQPDMNRQIEFIVKQLNSTDEPDEVESDDEDEEEDEEDQDAMEADLDKGDALKPQSGELAGDRLLNTHYVSTAPPGNRRKKPTDNVQSQEDVLRRPVTPSHFKGGDQPVVHVQPRSSVSESFYDRYYAPDFETEPDIYRPPTGRSRSQSGQSRPTSRDINRPPTRSGSRPTTGDEATPRPESVAKDPEGSEVVSKAMGSAKALAMVSKTANLKPSPKVLDNMQGRDPNVKEYEAAFSNRPKIPRTPDLSGGRPTSRGSVGDGPTPMPKYSDSLPTSRPGSGGRQSSNGQKTPSPRTPGTKHSSGRSKAR